MLGLKLNHVSKRGHKGQCDNPVAKNVGAWPDLRKSHTFGCDFHQSNLNDETASSMLIIRHLENVYLALKVLPTRKFIVCPLTWPWEFDSNKAGSLTRRCAMWTIVFRAWTSPLCPQVHTLIPQWIRGEVSKYLAFVWRCWRLYAVGEGRHVPTKVSGRPIQVARGTPWANRKRGKHN